MTLQDGTGLADVGVYYGATCAPTCYGPLVTTTNDDGYYEADVNCPFDHDETMHVCVILEGYTFTPEVSCWRTYGYCPDKETDFVGYPVRSPAP